MGIFNKADYPLSGTNAFNQIILDYLENDDKTKVLSQDSATLDGLQNRLKSQNERLINRELLVKVLKEQYAFLENEQERNKVFNRIDLLEDPQTFTICTGHQLNLFSGPFYTIFKIIATINAAKALEVATGQVILPVFWLASEDHDMDEINHFHIYGQRYEWKTEWKGPSGRASCEGIAEVILLLKEKFGISEPAKQWIEVLESAYNPSFSLAQATRRFLHSLFDKNGLLILDADDRRLKMEFVPHLLKDVNEHLAKSKIDATIEKFESFNYKAQVHPRIVNLFYLTKNSRIRIDLENDNFKLQDESKQWSRSEISEEIKLYPERFSPNVVLRPLYQESILPNIAVIGGPAEIAYWLELKDFFNSSNIAFPVLLLRNSALFLDETSLNRLAKFHIAIDQLFDTSDEWIKNFIKSGHQGELDLEESLFNLTKVFSQLSDQILEIDPTLKASIEAEQQRVIKTLKGIEEKAMRSIKRKHETDLQQIQKLHEKIFPNGQLQERSENILRFLFEYGDEFLEELIKELKPFSKTVGIFSQTKN